MKKQLVLVAIMILLVGISTVLGQRYDQKSLKIELHLKEPDSKKVHTYELETMAYYLSIDNSDDSLASEKSEAMIGVNCYLVDNLDNFLLQWTAQSPKYLDGEIVVSDIMANEIERKITFTKAELTGQNESFNKGSSYRAGADLTMKFETFKIDDVVMKE